MLVRHLGQIDGSEADVRADTFKSRRLVLARDGAGFSFHDTVLYAGTCTRMWYRNHVESVYCVEGRGELTDLETGDVHPVEPGTLYLLDDHDRHELRAVTELRVMCVFNPPLTGREVHDADGSYPLLTEEDGEGTGDGEGGRDGYRRSAAGDPTTDTEEEVPAR